MIHLLQVGFRRQAVKRRFFLNDQFNGVYSFSDAQFFKEHFRQWWKRAAEVSLTMCHPALPSGDKAAAAIDLAREEEYRVLSSDACAFLEGRLEDFASSSASSQRGT